MKRNKFVQGEKTMSYPVLDGNMGFLVWYGYFWIKGMKTIKETRFAGFLQHSYGHFVLYLVVCIRQCLFWPVSNGHLFRRSGCFCRLSWTNS